MADKSNKVDRGIGNQTFVDPFKGKFEREPTAFTAEDSNRLHIKADTDTARTASHHTLGILPNQASPGSHVHDGVSSNFIFSGHTISGAKGGNAALASVIAMLVQLGATDSTSA